MISTPLRQSIRRGEKGGIVVERETPNQPESESKESQLLEMEGIVVKLTDRERQMIGLIAAGLSNQEIGERLFITERSDRFHITSIFNKLGADNRAQAVAIVDQLDIF